jgi:hypothetical protein
MSEAEQDTPTSMPDELTVLKQRAKILGINHSNNIGVEALREKVRAKQEGEEEPKDDEQESQTQGNALNPLDLEAPAPVKGKKLSLRQYMHDTQMKLVRIRVTCMDPKKADLEGEIFTVANESLGTVRRFVPFGEATDDGWHVPYCIYRLMQARRFVNITTKKDKRTGHITVSNTLAKEFAIEVLPQLSIQELNRLRAAQAAAGEGG